MLFAIYVGIMLLNKNIVFTVKAFIICAGGVCIPMAIATYLLASCINEMIKRFKIIKAFLFIIFIFYIMGLVNVLFIRYRHFGAINIGLVNIAGYAKWNVNYIPFKTIGNYLNLHLNNSINRTILIEKLLGNIFLFAPVGILLPFTNGLD